MVQLHHLKNNTVLHFNGCSCFNGCSHVISLIPQNVTTTNQIKSFNFSNDSKLKFDCLNTDRHSYLSSRISNLNIPI